MIRYGILGFGLHAVRRLMPGFEHARRSTVTALWRRDAGKAQEAVQQYPQFPLRTFDSPESLCASPDVDAIFVASPDALHLSHVLLALEHRKPVLCEKPMGMNSAECERMVAAADKAGVLLGVAHNFRFNRSVNRLREIVAAGKIGQSMLSRSEFHYPAHTSPRVWIADPKLACSGPIGDVGVHCVDTLRYILQDEVVSVEACALYGNQPDALEHAATLTLEFESASIGSVIVSARSDYRTPLWIDGDAGSTGAEDALTVEHVVELVTKPIGVDAVREQVSNANAYTAQVDAFSESIERGVPFVAPGIEGLRNQQVLDAAYRSIKSGRREKV